MTNRKAKKHPEYDNQVAFFQWVFFNRKQAPAEVVRDALSLCYANLNGAYLPRIPNEKGGSAWSPEAIRLSKSGMTEGIPDINLDWPGDRSVIDGGRQYGCERYAGLRIEMKAALVGEKKKELVESGNFLVHLSPSQKRKRELFISGNFRYVVCYSARQAIKAVVDYLGYPVEYYRSVNEFLEYLK